MLARGFFDPVEEAVLEFLVESGQSLEFADDIVVLGGLDRQAGFLLLLLLFRVGGRCAFLVLADELAERDQFEVGRRSGAQW